MKDKVGFQALTFQGWPVIADPTILDGLYIPVNDHILVHPNTWARLKERAEGSRLLVNNKLSLGMEKLIQILVKENEEPDDIPPD